MKISYLTTVLVGRARERRQARFCSDQKITCNARMTSRAIKQHCRLTSESQELIRIAMTELNLSARAYDRILKVSRTVADLAGAESIAPEDVRGNPVPHFRSHLMGLASCGRISADLPNEYRTLGTVDRLSAGAGSGADSGPLPQRRARACQLRKFFTGLR